MRLSKQIDQIFQLVDEFHDDTSYPVGVTVDECWIYAGDVAGIRKFLLCSDPSVVQCRDGCDELPDVSVVDNVSNWRDQRTITEVLVFLCAHVVH